MALLSFDDETPIWFGKHGGTPLGEIDAGYLLWLWDEAGYWAIKQPTAQKQALHDYLKTALNDLCEEAGGYIPKHP